MDPFEVEGYWWLPEHPEKKYPGTLSFSNDGLKLKIFGSFEWDMRRSGDLTAFTDYPRIKGRTLEGKHFTLFDCGLLNSIIMEPPDYCSETIRAEYAFETVVTGLGRTPPDPEAFFKAIAQYTYLPDWIGRSGLLQGTTPNRTTQQVDRIELTYRSWEKVSVDLGYTKISIVKSYAPDYKNLVTQGLNLYPIFEFEIEAEQELSFEEWRGEFIWPLSNFLTLATDRPNATTKLTLYSKLSEADSAGVSPKISTSSVYLSDLGVGNSRKMSSLKESDVLFGLRDVEAEFAQIIKVWMTEREKFAKSATLFFAVKNASGIYLEHKYLSLVQALEIYHRERFSSNVSPAIIDEHSARAEAVLNAVPIEYREWLEAQLRLNKQVRLKQRILELLDHLEPVASRFVKHKEIFAGKITKTRNFLTHYSGKSKGVMEELELNSATQVTAYMLQTCIMLELDLPIEKIVSFFERNQQFRFTASHIKQAYDWA